MRQYALDNAYSPFSSQHFPGWTLVAGPDLAATPIRAGYTPRRQRRAPPTASLVFCVLCQALLSLLWVVASAVYGRLVASGAAAAELDFTRSAVATAAAAGSISAVLWFVDAVAACACREGGEAQKADDAEEQGGQGLEGNSGVGVGLQGTETKGAQEMKDQRSDALPPYSEVESTVEFGKNLPRVG
ncbi:hypothetical protein ARSEF4850_008585 [Beauveria asiatica]